MSTVLIYNVKNSKYKEKTLKEKIVTVVFIYALNYDRSVPLEHFIHK